MKTKVTNMMAPGSFLVVICAVLVYSAGLGNTAPTELTKSTESAEDGAYPRAATTIVPPTSNDAKLWPPQKPSSRSKHIIKSNLYKKPTKDKGGRIKGTAGEKAFYSSTLVSTGYDVEKDNLSRHKEAPSTGTGTVVDNVNGPKDYTNKTRTNSTTQQQSIPPHSDRTQSISTNADDDDDDVVDGAGKDIDFISVAGTTKSDENYATATTTEGYHAKAGASTTATMQTGLVENPNFNAEPIAKMSTKSLPHAKDIKSIYSPAVVAPTPANGKSLPVNASVSSSLSLSFTQSSVTTTLPPRLDVGHDGVKITKKKQLFDKHFIAAPGPSPLPSGSLHLPITKDNPWPLSKNKPTKSGKKLMEVPNGYLGPIMMKEKTFSVSHHGKKPKPSIADQLRDKKLVEIIAPTALMEPTIKVKSSIPPPEFIAIDSTSSSVTSTTTTSTTTTTEGPSVLTNSSPVPTVATSKEEEIESETATTYFLVVTQDSKISGKPSIDTEMQPMNSGEIETTLREIYTEVLNAMEGASKKKSTTTETPKINENDETTSTITAVTDHAPVTDGGNNFDHVLSTSNNDLHLPNHDPGQSLYPDSDRQRSTVTDRSSNTPSATDSVETLSIDHVTPSESPRLTPTEIDRVLPSVTYHSSKVTTQLGAHKSTTFPVTYHGSSTQIPSFPIRSEKLSTVSIDASTIIPQTLSTPRSTQNVVLSMSALFDDVPTKADRSSTETSFNKHSPSDNDHVYGESTSITDHIAAQSSISTQAIPMQDHAPITENVSTITTHNLTPIAVDPNHGLSPSTDGTSAIPDHGLSAITDSIATITDHSSTTSPPIAHHDSSAGPSSTSSSITETGTSTYLPVTARISDPSPTFATITTDSYISSSTTHQQSLKPTHDSEQTESKISDIQIEVYDSTLEPILASTNFKDNTGGHYPSSHATTKQASSNSLPQERFTQYVVDKATDFATQDSNSVAKASGKPEPAAIEIHINVSEGFGNESEDLEFSYRQADYRKVTSKKPANTNFITLKPFDAVPQNETSNEAAEEIVVEIIDSNSNSTENSASRENLNVNPIFTFRSDDDSQVELKNVKYYPEDRPKEGKKSTDDFFVPHVGQQPPGVNKPMMDRDSDTIFYISNTEVKVGESLPTTNTYDAQLKKSRLESQFFPANYEERKKAAPQRYEEDIILSPLKNRVLDPLKVVRGPLDISYVGESVMEVEQVTVTTTIAPPITGSTPDVIIQPAVLPEMAIGVPVIGELPPQIELKEIDFMPNFDGNKEESSIQYGGDLIDEGGAMGAGFDMDSYPLGNLGMGQRNDAIPSQMVLNHRVNHLKKDELSADLAASSETTDGNDLLHRSNDSVNGTVIGEKMGNATAYSVMEEPPSGDRVLHFTDLHTLFTACLATLLPLVLSVVMAFGLRHLYHKYQTNPFNVMGHNSSTDPLDAEKGTGGDGDDDGVETPEEDISRDARETKMHYNNSEKDGVFVVEVSRGADSKIMPGSPVADPDEKRLFNLDAAAKIIEEDKLLSNHEEVQIHPPPPENVNVHDEIESNHLHQIDEVDEFEEGTKITKHSNTGLSQSDLSSSSSVDSNKRYSYGNQELYTIEQQDYTTPSPAATKAPHPHVDPQPPQPENHNDDNGHSENGHFLENGQPSAPNCDSIYPADTDSEVNGHNGVESKPKITAALLKQDTVIVNEMTNGLNHNINEDDEDDQTTPLKLTNGVGPITEISNTLYGDTENGFDSIISLPDPPSTEEMKQMNDIILMETNQLDSLPPPPPPGAENHQHHNGNGIAPEDTENGDSHSIVSATSPMNTPTKILSPPTITLASAPTDIPHTNGNCMTGHTTTSTAAVVEVSGSS